MPRGSYYFPVVVLDVIFDRRAITRIVAGLHSYRSASTLEGTPLPYASMTIVRSSGLNGFRRSGEVCCMMHGISAPSMIWNTSVPSGSTTTLGTRICHSDRSSWEGYPVGDHDGISSAVMGYLLWRLIVDRQSSSTWE